MLNLILFGPPGSGKGTQSVRLSKKYNLIHLSTGDMLRGQIAKGTELGLAAKAIMDRGELVPDKIVIGMIETQLNENPSADGFIFDGFPRTIMQAMALDDLLEKHETRIAATLSLEVSDPELLVRLLERGKESGRADDQNESVIQNRINVYNSQTSPLIEYYKNEGKYKPIAGMGNIEQVFDLLCHEIDHLDAGEAHGEGILSSQEEHQHTNQKSNNKKHKNQQIMLHEHNNDQHNHDGHHNDEHNDEKHSPDHNNNDGHDNNHDDDHKDEEHHDEKHEDANDHGDAHHEEKTQEQHEAPAPKAVKKAKPAAKKKAAPAKKKAAKKPAAKKPAAKKKAAKKPAKKKAAKKSAPKKKSAKKSAPKKKGGKKAAPKKKAAKAKKGGAKKAKKAKGKKRK